MHEMIGNEAANVESAMIQVVGRAQDAECDSCLRDHGPWAQCVVLDGPVGLVCGCANCHWDSNDSRCTSFGAGSPDGTPATYRQFPPAGPNQPRFAQSSVARLQVLEGHHPVPTTSRHDRSLGTSTNAAHQAAGVDWLIARKPQSRDIMRRAMANVRDNKVIHQTLINTTEAVAESVNDSTASSDQTLQDNIALTVGAVATNGRNVKAIEISTQEMQAEILMLYSRLEEAQLQLANLNARQTRPL
ncbi:hypothetical protein N7524_003486 [Penicillium chrysogenum]|nr:hypothetical protein N7524_003486 [Penicillium chrysogenum]